MKRYAYIGVMVALCCRAENETNIPHQREDHLHAPRDYHTHLLRKGALSKKRKKELYGQLLQRKGDWYSSLSSLKKSDTWQECLHNNHCVADIINEAAHIFGMRREALALYLATPAALAWIAEYRQYSPLVQQYLDNRLLMMSLNYYVDLAEIENILRAGANSNAINKADMLCDDLGGSVLANAVSTRNVPLVKLLLAHGADANIRDSQNGYTPLDYAVRRNSEELVALLLDNGARSSAYYTLLMQAIERANPAIVKLLLQTHVYDMQQRATACAAARERYTRMMHEQGIPQMTAEQVAVITMLGE